MRALFRICSLGLLFAVVAFASFEGSHGTGMTSEERHNNSHVSGHSGDSHGGED